MCRSQDRTIIKLEHRPVNTTSSQAPYIHMATIRASTIEVAAAVPTTRPLESASDFMLLLPGKLGSQASPFEGI